MKDVAKQYNFTMKESASIRYSSLFKGVEFGSLNGSNDSKNMGLKVSEIRTALQNESGEKPLSIWLKRSSPSGRNWNLTRPDVLPSLALELRSSIGSLRKERFAMSHLFPLLPEFSLVTERQVELRSREITTVSHILALKQRRLETFIRQTLLDRDTSEVQKELPDSIPSILWMWQVIQHSQVSSPINRLSLFANILLKHGDSLGSPEYPRWIMRWLLQEEDAILIAYLNLSASICSWEYIWSLFHKGNLVEMPLLRVLMDSGRREFSEDIIVLLLLPLREPANDSLSITIMRNPTGVLLKKNMAQDSPEYSEPVSGNPLYICQGVLSSKDISIPMEVLISLLRREKFPLSEKLILMAELRSMVLLISLEENLRDNMLLLLSLLIERDWLLNKKIKSSNVSLSQLRVIFFLLYLQLRGKHNLVSDVMIFLSIKNKLAML
jgi:hypothetical protein